MFFLLVFALSIPFLLFGAFTGLQLLPGVPVAALAIVCPLMAAVILVYQENKIADVAGLLKRGFDYKLIRVKIWYAPILLLMPGVTVLSFGVMRWMGMPLPNPQFEILPAFGLLVGFFIGALAEELGWMGYAIDPMQSRMGAFLASILLGVVWAAWHIVPLLQVHRPTVWIAWWCLGTIAMRVLMVWLYNNTGNSVFAVALFHTMFNLSWQLFPIHGSLWDPRFNGLITALVAFVVTLTWGPQTLARYSNT